jgi:hypothetical protein
MNRVLLFNQTAIERQDKMGYTHYWRFNTPKRGTTAKIDAAYQTAIKDCTAVIQTYYKANGGLSGFTAHAKPGQYGGLEVNGARELSHEPMVLREHFKQNESFNFCKTNRKPYDVVVVACLCILQHHLGTNISVSSDGNTLDWVAGLELARRTLKNKSIAIPANIERALGVARGS